MLRRALQLCLAICLLALCAAAEGLPPDAPLHADAPQALLEEVLFLPGEGVAAIQALASCEDRAAFSGQRLLEDGRQVSALWEVDLTRGTCKMVYEAPEHVQIQTPVYCGGLLYWAEWREDDFAGWYIRQMDTAEGISRLVRADPYESSTLAPSLYSDGEAVYWYESEGETSWEPPYDLLLVTLYMTAEEVAPQALLTAQVPNDWQPPWVQDGVLALGQYDMEEGQWRLDLLDIQADALRYGVSVDKMPSGIRHLGDWLTWRQDAAGGQAEDPDGELTGEGEENSLYLDAAALTGGQVFLFNHRQGASVSLGGGIDAITPAPQGTLYVTDTHLLCLYSYALGRPLKLTGHADYLPLLTVYEDRLIAVRAIWDGRQVLYRLVAMDLSPLGEGWPPLY